MTRIDVRPSDDHDGYYASTRDEPYLCVAAETKEAARLKAEHALAFYEHYLNQRKGP